MQFQPLRALITRDDDNDPKHETLHDVPGMIPGVPEVGTALQLFLDSGKVMRTSAVQHVERHGSEMVIDTANSRYRLKLSNAA
jgi:hypothetical protein